MVITKSLSLYYITLLRTKIPSLFVFRKKLYKKCRSMSHLVYYNIDNLTARYKVMQYLSANHTMYYDELYKYLRSRGDVPFRSI